ncbi:dihydrolipoyl dehydrogenase family protein [Isoptericola cucumis]|uniref:Pyridine nucleotide-disulfide oxidoreductase n=1 Tax=Isoptericola cucumis TaxID=1776856 RepID=A0ABQ2B2X2_9MICO|nr:NAD(P)/FAD-dependent oxidoreductase [Isoptericola cucumis]GGI06639.1 pyridine nucleotide-disulfide oxidoreductase [Isoptericola cucumis]
MTTETPVEPVDVVVIGTGPGGEDAAARLARAGLDVVAVEARLVGGECPYYGCIPTKMMVRAADALAEARRVATIAGRADVHPDWEPVARRIRDEATTGWDDTAAVERLESAGGRLVRGRGRLAGPGEVVVTTADGERRLQARRAVVLNPGTEPLVPPIDGLAGTPYWTNREAVEAAEAPASLTVLGGGAIGCELAQVFARFGTAVEVIEAGERLVAADEPEASDLVAARFAAEGIGVRTGTSARRVSYDDGSFVVHLDDGTQVTSERLLISTGRRTDLAALGVASVGLDEHARTITVDDRLRAADGVWAIGDATGHGAFTHVSMYQARIAVADILGDGDERADYRAVPHVTFTDPEVGAVGLTEAAARDAGLTVRTGVTDLAASSRGFVHGPGNEGLIKLVEDADRGVLVGATAAGPAAGEILAVLTLAVHAQVPTAQLRRMIYAYPTFHRAIESALADLDEG